MKSRYTPLLVIGIIIPRDQDVHSEITSLAETRNFMETRLSRAVKSKGSSLSLSLFFYAYVIAPVCVCVCVCSLVAFIICLSIVLTP